MIDKQQIYASSYKGMRTRGKGRLTRSPKHISETDELSEQIQQHTRAVSEPVEITYQNATTSAFTEKSNESSQSGDGKQQHLSLEALCQAARSELQIISKEKGQEEKPETTTLPPVTITSTQDIQFADNSVIQVAAPESQNIVLGTEGSSEAELFNLEKITTADGGEAWVLKPSSKKMLYQSNDTSGTSTSVDTIESSSPQYITVPYTPTTPGVVHYVGQQEMDRQIGRRRKHPAKPGKHICPYCSRGCAKPSVLEKHIRAHTGERPYPCDPCGFSFKTKSNLYKHCKSRAHQMKVANSTSTSSQTSSMDTEEMEEEGSSFDSDVQGSSSKIKNMKAIKSPGTKLILPAMTPPQGSSPVIIGQQSTPPVMLLLKQNQEGTAVVKQAMYTLGSSPPQGATIVSPAIAQQSKVIVSTPQIAKINSPPTVIIKPPSSQMLKIESKGSIDNVYRLPSVNKMDDLSNLKSTVEKLPGNSMKVTIQLPKPETSYVGVKQSTVGHALGTSAVGLPRTPLGKPNIPAVPKLPAPAKNITPDELKERISYLIDTNQAIVNTPMAEPPRPKRFARQRSEILLGSSDSDTFSSATFSDGTHLTAGPLTPKEKFGRAASFDVGQLKKVELNNSGLSSITGTRDTDLVSVIPLSKVDESVRNPGKSMTVMTSSTLHNLPDSFPPPSQGIILNQESGDIVLQSSVVDDDDDNDQVIVNEQDDDGENPLIVINTTNKDLNTKESGVIDISDDDSVNFQESVKPMSVEEGIAKHMKSIQQLSQDKQSQETVQISLETSELNEDGSFSEEGKSFACMDCHFIFSTLKDVMKHLVESCVSVHSGTGSQKIDVFNTDGSHSILTVVKKSIVEKPTSSNTSTSNSSLVSVVPNVSIANIESETVDSLSPNQSVNESNKSDFDQFKLKSDSLSSEVMHVATHSPYSNVVLEMVDPTAPLKRGRPKGSRNRPKESISSNEGSLSSEIVDAAFVGAWKTPPVGAGPFNFPSKGGSQDVSPLSQDVDVVQFPVTEGMFKGYKSATASMKALKLSIPQQSNRGISSPPLSYEIRPKLSSPLLKVSTASPVKSVSSPFKLLPTPKADAKKALQSHILMKRSLSVEKTTQEKHRQLSLPTGTIVSEKLTEIKLNPLTSLSATATPSKNLKVKDMLRPTRSLEDPPPTKRPRLQRQASVFEAPPENDDNVIVVLSKGKEGLSIPTTLKNSMQLPTGGDDSKMLHESYSIDKNSSSSSKVLQSPPKCIITITPPPITIEQDVKDILANIIKLAKPSSSFEYQSNIQLPYNEGKTFIQSDKPTTAPNFKIPLQDSQKLQMVNLPVSFASKLPGMLVNKTESEEDLKEDKVSILGTTDDLDVVSKTDQEKTSDDISYQEITKEKENSPEMLKEKEINPDKLDDSRLEENMDVTIEDVKVEDEKPDVASSVTVSICTATSSEKDFVLHLSDGSVFSSEQNNKAELNKHVVLDLEKIGKEEKLSIPEHLQDKTKIVMMLLGHSYPVLNSSTHGTLCSVTKPQPMYVKQSDNQKISMYSTWRAAPFNPNPEGLSTKQLLTLYKSSQLNNHPYVISAESEEISKPNVTDSFDKEEKVNLFVSSDDKTSKSSADSSYALKSSSKFNERQTAIKRSNSGLICTTKEFVSKEKSPKQSAQKTRQEQFQKKDKMSSAKSASDTIQPMITVQSIPHSVENEDGKKVFILPKPQLGNEMLSFEGNFEMQNFSLQGSDYILLQPRVPAHYTAQQKRHQLQAHGLKGYKSEENYTYVRGRGRGKYVCQECGIRCKKPSMLRKHLKTHTDMRPYHCKYCMFSFKTKGNLTKHMKSKAHHKKCTELGIHPVPVYVDDTCVLTEEQMKAQNDFTPGDEDQSIEQTVIIDGTIPVLQTSASQLSAMGSSLEDDDDEDEDDSLDKGEEIVEVIEEQVSFDNMLVLDEAALQQHNAIATQEKQKPEEKYITVRNTENGEPMVLKLTKSKDGQTRTEILPLTPEHKQKLKEGFSRDSIDKEAANSLLDLAQRPQDGEGSDTNSQVNSTKLDLSSSGGSQKSIDDRLEGLIGQLVQRTDVVGSKITDAEGTKSHDSSFTIIEHPLLYASSDLKFKDNINNNGHIKSTDGQSSSKSGFVPPLFEESPKSVKSDEPPPLIVKFSNGNFDDDQTKELLNNLIKDKLKPGQKVVLQGIESSSLPSVIGDNLQSPSESESTPHKFVGGPVKVETLYSEPLQSSLFSTNPATTSLHDTETASVNRGLTSQSSLRLPKPQLGSSAVGKSLSEGETYKSSSRLSVLQPKHVKLQRQKSHDEDRSDKNHLQNYLDSIQKKQYNDSGKKVVELGVKIKPIPGRVNESELEKIDGKYICKMCEKVFHEGHLLEQHLKVHAIEQPFKCSECMTSFRTSELLQRHMSSESHLATLSLKKRLGLYATDDPRPYKCQDCNVAFRIHGHLAKHLRSKMHLMQLENMGKIPMGTSMELDKIGPQMNVLDAESCLQDILSMISTGVIKVDQSSDIIRPGFTNIKDYHTSSASSPSNTFITSAEPVSTVVSERAMIGGQTVVVSSIMTTPSKTSPLVSTQHVRSPLMIDVNSVDKDTASLSPFHNTAATLRTAPHKCGICGSSFIQIELLKEHLVSHAELRPYVCEFCDAGFTTAKSLQAHLLSHATPAKKYSCTNCGKAFSEINELVTHSQLCLQQVGISSSSSPVNVRTEVISQSPTPSIQSQYQQISPKLSYIHRSVDSASTSVSLSAPTFDESKLSQKEVIKTLPKSSSDGGNVQVIPFDGKAVQMKEVYQEQPDGTCKAVKVMVINWDSVQQGNSSQQSKTMVSNITSVAGLQTVATGSSNIDVSASSSDHPSLPLVTSVVLPNSGSLFDSTVDLDVDK